MKTDERLPTLWGFNVEFRGFMKTNEVGEITRRHPSHPLRVKSVET